MIKRRCKKIMAVFMMAAFVMTNVGCASQKEEDVQENVTQEE